MSRRTNSYKRPSKTDQDKLDWFFPCHKRAKHQSHIIKQQNAQRGSFCPLNIKNRTYVEYITQISPRQRCSHNMQRLGWIPTYSSTTGSTSLVSGAPCIPATGEGALFFLPLLLLRLLAIVYYISLLNFNQQAFFSVGTVGCNSGQFNYQLVAMMG